MEGSTVPLGSVPNQTIMDLVTNRHSSRHLAVPILRRPLIPVLLLLLGLSSCGSDYESAGMEAFEKGDFKSAVSYFNVALRSSDNENLRYHRGLAQAKLNRVDPALKELRPFFSDPARGPRALEALVMPLIKLTRADEIEPDVRAALDADPENPTLLRTMSRIKSFDYDLQRRFLTDTIQARAASVGANFWTNEAQKLCAAPTDQAYDQELDEYLKQLNGATGSPTDAKLLEKLRKLRLATQERQAINAKVVAVDPQSFEDLLELAQVAALRGNFEQSERLGRGVLNTSPEDLESRERIGDLTAAKIRALDLVRSGLEKQGRIDEAIALIEEALKDPAIARAPQLILGNACRLHYQAGNHDRILELTDQWLRINSKDPWPAFYKGTALHAKGEYGQALTYLDRAHAAAPSAALFTRMLGLTYMKTGDKTRAVSALERAMHQQPRDLQTILDLSDAYVANGQQIQAQELLSLALRNQFRTPNTEAHRETMKALMALYNSAGQNIDSLPQARFLQSRDPDNPYIGLRLAQLEAQAGNHRTAERLIRRVQRTLPELQDAWRVAASVALESEKWNQALGHLEKLEELSPTDPNIAWMRAEAYFNLDRLEDAQREAKRAVIANPMEVGPNLVLLDIEKARNDHGAIMRIAEKLLKDFPGDPEILEAAAEAAVAVKDWPRAESALSQLVIAQPENGAAALLRGKVLLALNSEPEALSEFERATELLVAQDPAKAVEAVEAVSRKNPKAFRSTLIQLQEKLDDEDLKRRVLVRLVYAELYSGNLLGSANTLREIRLLGGEIPASGMAIRLAQSHGNPRSAISLFKVGKRTAHLPDHALPAVLEAAESVSDWPTVLEIAHYMGQRRAGTAGRLAAAKARANLGIGNLPEARRIIKNGLESLPSEDTYELKRLQLELSCINNPDEVLKFLPQVITAHPNEVDPMRLGAYACLMNNRHEEAMNLARRAVQLSATPETIQRLVAICATKGEFASALEYIKRGQFPNSDRWRDLLRASIGTPPSKLGGLAEGLLQIQSGMSNKVITLLPEDNVPSTMGPWLNTVANRLATKKRSGAVFARAVTLAIIARDFVEIGRSVKRVLDGMAREHEELATEIETLIAWVAVSVGQPQQAAQIMVGRVNTTRAQGFELYLFVLAAMRNAGVGSVMTIFQNVFGQSILPQNVADDMALALIEVKKAEAARAILTRTRKGVANHAVPLAELEFREGKQSAALELVGAMDMGTLRKKSLLLAALRLKTRLVDPSGSVTTEEMEFLFKNRHRMSPAAAMLSLEAAVRSRRPTMTQEFLQRAVVSSGFDPYSWDQINRTLMALPGFQEESSKLLRGLDTFDPTGMLRGDPTETFFNGR